MLLHIDVSNKNNQYIKGYQHGWYFIDIFKGILSNENFRIANKISLRYIPQGLIDNESALVQIMAWCLTGNKPLPETPDQDV